MKKTVIVGVLFVLAVFFLSKKTFNQQAILPTIAPAEKTVEIDIAGKAKIIADLAQTSEEKAKGLSERENLDDNQGMLFVFDDYFQPAFWMKDMLIPIDIIWIRDEKIVDITENIPPPEPDTAISDLQTYLPKESINYVLEVPAGFASSHNIQIGDIINLKFQI